MKYLDDCQSIVKVLRILRPFKQVTLSHQSVCSFPRKQNYFGPLKRESVQSKEEFQIQKLFAVRIMMVMRYSVLF
jgi:hypothetical protein